MSRKKAPKLPPAPTGPVATARRWWNDFWFAESPTLNVGIFRILLAVALALDVGPASEFNVFAMQGGFHLPYTRWIAPLSPAGYQAIHLVQYPLLALLAMGVSTRLVAGALFALQGYVFFADQLDFRNHAYLYLLLLLFFAVTPLEEPLNASGVLRGLRSGTPAVDVLVGQRGPATRRRLIQVQVCIVYVYAALHKLHPAFLDGSVMSANLVTWWPDTPLAALLGTGHLAAARSWLSDPSHLAAPSVAAAALELLLPLGLVFRRTRPVALVLGSGFHLMIWLSMNIGSFSLAMVSTYVLFLDPETLPALGRRWLNRRARTT